MATVTPNIGLTKPAGTENVNLGLINENYDKIDTAVGNLQDDIDDNAAALNGLFKIVKYTYNVSINANSTKHITANDLNISTPAGYKPIAFVGCSYSFAYCAITFINALATLANIAISLRNVTDVNTGEGTVSMSILYAKTGFVE